MSAHLIFLHHLAVPVDGKIFRHVGLKLLVLLPADLLPSLLSSSPDGGLTQGHLIEVETLTLLLGRLEDGGDNVNGHQEIFSGLDEAWSGLTLVFQQLLVLKVKVLNISLNSTLGYETCLGPILLHNFSDGLVNVFRSGRLR